MTKLQESTVILSVRWHQPNRNRPGQWDGVEIDADRDSVRMTKEIIRSENYNRCMAVRNKTRDYLKKIALPSPFKGGMYLVPVDCLDLIVGRLDEAKQEYEIAADALVDEYPQIVESAKKRLRTQFRPEEFPSAERLRRGFGVEWQVLDFQVPEKGRLGEVLWEQEKTKAEQRWKETEGRISLALQTGLQELVDHLVVQLKSSDDGEKKRIHPAAVRKVNEFLDMFSKRNVLNDKELEKLVSQAKQVLEGKEAQDLRNDEAIRNNVQDGLSKVTKSLSGMITSTKRAFDFDD